jgi:hypothetical protein
MARGLDRWQDAWLPVVAQVGADMSDGVALYGTDLVEAGAIRRFLEPLEFECALHTDTQVAQAHGYRDVTAPYVAASTFAMGPVWRSGEPVFTSADRNAQPAHASVKPSLPPGAPAVTGYFATDMEIEFLRPVVAGDRLGRRGNRLIACTPKETRVGRGAFVTFESDIVDVRGEPVARTRVTLFLYEPYSQAGA